MISENGSNFIVLKHKELQTIIAMITEDKVTELFCIADDFCKLFWCHDEKNIHWKQIRNGNIIATQPCQRQKLCLSWYCFMIQAIVAWNISFGQNTPIYKVFPFVVLFVQSISDKNTGNYPILRCHFFTNTKVGTKLAPEN